MSGEAILRIGADASGAKAGLAETVAANKRAVAQIQADSQRASTADRTQANNDAALKRQLQRQEYADRVRALADKRRADEAAAKARAKIEGDVVKAAAKAESDKTKESAKQSKLREAIAMNEAKVAKKEKDDEAKAAAKAESDKTKAAEAEARQRQRRADQDRAREEREEIASTRRTLAGQYRARRRTEQENRRRRTREDRDQDRFVGGAPTAVAGAALAGVAAFSQYGDDLREQRRARDAITTRAGGIAAGDIGDSTVTPQLMQATQNVSKLTGLDPQGVIEAVGEAQANFSSLADAASRGTYLGTVLPMLGRAAVATNSSLTDMVNAAGEFQRQLHISNADLPAAIARAIVEGRMGSVGFKDYAAHAGTLMGAASRSFSPDAADAPQTQALVGGLFQAAGQAGGGGGEAATRTQAFLNNMSSARGQRALRAGVGYNPFTSTGQLATRPGENQRDAFARLAETAFSRSHGNATRFLDMFAGHRDEARTLGDQLFRDLTTHGGHLTTFQEHASATLSATPGSAIDAPFNAQSRLPGPTRAREDVAAFWRQSGDAANYAVTTEQQQRAFARAHPFIARAMDNPISTSVRDTANAYYQEDDAARIAPPIRPAAAGDTRAVMQARLALSYGRSRVARDNLDLGASASPAAERQMIEQQSVTELARLRLGDETRARGGNPATISDAAIAQFAQRNAEALLQALRGVQLTVQPASPPASSGSMPPTP